MRIVNQSNFNGTADFEEFTPRASVSFHPAEDQTIYASYSRGFKGGGFDPRGVTTACRDAGRRASATPQQIFDFMSFDPETVTSYELGYRAAAVRPAASPSPGRCSTPIIPTSRCRARSAP